MTAPILQEEKEHLTSACTDPGRSFPFLLCVIKYPYISPRPTFLYTILCTILYTMLSTIYLPWYIPWYIPWYTWYVLWWYVASLVRAQGQPPRKFHFFAKNLENRQNIGRFIGRKVFFDAFLMAICGHLRGDSLGAKHFLKNVRFGCRD